jgi:hypothetical protein
MQIAVVACLLLLVLIGGAWLLLSPRSRRTKELKAGPRRFHWGMIAAYRGDADPTALDRAEAQRILQSDWSLKDVDRLRALLSRYRAGEINPAFDSVRIVWLGELAVSAGWFTFEEATQWSEPEWRRARSSYRSWAEYESALLEGRLRWWAEIARKPLPEWERARSAEVRAEAKLVFDAVPWA